MSSSEEKDQAQPPSSIPKKSCRNPPKEEPVAPEEGSTVVDIVAASIQALTLKMSRVAETATAISNTISNTLYSRVDLSPSGVAVLLPARVLPSQSEVGMNKPPTKNPKISQLAYELPESVTSLADPNYHRMSFSPAPGQTVITDKQVLQSSTIGLQNTQSKTMTGVQRTEISQNPPSSDQRQSTETANATVLETAPGKSITEEELAFFEAHMTRIRGLMLVVYQTMVEGGICSENEPFYQLWMDRAGPRH